jgi:hypothetical protein
MTSKIEKPKKTQEKKKKTKRKCPECRCGNSGQSCIVMRRYCGDIVFEDKLFKEKDIPIRLDCFSPFTDAQREVMDEFHQKMTDEGCHSITNRWSTEPV